MEALHKAIERNGRLRRLQKIIVRKFARDGVALRIRHIKFGADQRDFIGDLPFRDLRI